MNAAARCVRQLIVIAVSPAVYTERMMRLLRSSSARTLQRDLYCSIINLVAMA